MEFPKSTVLMINVDAFGYCLGIAETLLKTGCEVVILDRSERALDEALDILPETDKLHLCLITDIQKDVRELRYQFEFTLGLLFDSVTSNDYVKYADHYVDRMIFDHHKILKETEHLNKFVWVSSYIAGGKVFEAVKKDAIDMFLSYPSNDVCVRHVVLNSSTDARNFVELSLQTVKEAPINCITTDHKGKRIRFTNDRKEKYLGKCASYSIDTNVDVYDLTDKYMGRCSVYNNFK